jgi:YD repeat-containing protein
LSSSTDENGRTTGYQYADSLARLTEIDYPDQGRTTNSYSDVLYTPSVTTTKLLGAAGSNVATTVMDGVGHVTDTNVNSSIYVHSAYDGSGRVWCKSYPYSGGSLPSCGANFPGDTYAYDALGRVTGAAHPDGTAVQASYAGRATKVIDEAGIARVTQSDALGRLRSVCEVTATTLQVGSDRSPVACGQDIAATGFLTTYQYDALDNLLDVHQSNPSPDRQFAYDSLSRLVTASNPESGTMYYAYDPNGNLLTRTRPAPNQANPAVTVTTTYVYDSLNRVARKTYSDGVTPEVDFVYDQAAASFGGPQHSSAFANGRLSFAFIPNSATDIYSYDQMGRVTDTWQCVTAPCTAAWDAHQVYDLGGDMLSVGYNSGATLNYSYDGTQRLSTVSGSGLSGLPATLFSPTQGQQQYGPVGLLYATLGNNLAEARAYNNRTWLSSLTVGSSGSVYSLGLGYAGNGDVTSATDSVNSNWSYCYDDFNRLTGANTPPQSCTANPQTYGYLYDRFGNRWQQSQAGQGCVALSFNGSNQISIPGYQYDAAGNLLMDNFNCYTFDAENRLSSVAPETTANIERLSDRVIGSLKRPPEGTGEAGNQLETVCLAQRLWAMIQ